MVTTLLSRPDKRLWGPYFAHSVPVNKNHQIYIFPLNRSRIGKKPVYAGPYFNRHWQVQSPGNKLNIFNYNFWNFCFGKLWIWRSKAKFFFKMYLFYNIGLWNLLSIEMFCNMKTSNVIISEIKFCFNKPIKK